MRDALAEDVGSGDITAQLVPSRHKALGRLIVRDNAVLCGTRWWHETFHQLSSEVHTHWHANDGEKLQAGQTVCEISGPAQALLSGERTALNLLQMLSATATTTARFQALISGTKTRLLDTRKTIPGFREAQKYAVRCGGGTNHRMGLYDAFLIKENHIAVAGSITAAIEQARENHPQLPVEVEVEDQRQLQEAVAAGADQVLLDNFTIAQLKEAVAGYGGQTALEASGGVSDEHIREIAETGVDYVSVGALTKHISAVDFSLGIDLRTTDETDTPDCRGTLAARQ